MERSVLDVEMTMWRDWQARLVSIICWKIIIHEEHDAYIMNNSFSEKMRNTRYRIQVVFKRLNSNAFLQSLINLFLRPALRLSKCLHWTVQICCNVFAFILGIVTCSRNRGNDLMTGFSDEYEQSSE